MQPRADAPRDLADDAPLRAVREGARSDGRKTRGAVYVEFLIAFLPFFVFFLCLWQISILYYTKLMVDHAAFAAARAAAVIVAENPNRVDLSGGPKSVNVTTDSRMGLVRTAAELALAPLILDGTIFSVDLVWPSQPNGADALQHTTVPGMGVNNVSLMRVRVETMMTCRIALANAIMCPPRSVLGFVLKQGLGAFILPVKAEGVYPYQGASYVYDPNDDKDDGASGSAAQASNLTGGSGSSGSNGNSGTSGAGHSGSPGGGSGPAPIVGGGTAPGGGTPGAGAPAARPAATPSKPSPAVLASNGGGFAGGGGGSFGGAGASGSWDDEDTGKATPGAGGATTGAGGTTPGASGVTGTSGVAGGAFGGGKSSGGGAGGSYGGGNGDWSGGGGRSGGGGASGDWDPPDAGAPRPKTQPTTPALGPIASLPSGSQPGLSPTTNETAAKVAPTSGSTPTSSSDSGGSGGKGGNAGAPTADTSAPSTVPNWKSEPNWGHAFTRHGQGKKVTTSLTGRTQKKGQQGQWLNNEAAANYLWPQKPGPGQTRTIPIPPGMGQLIPVGGGTPIPANYAIIVVGSDGKIVTAYPIPAPGS